MIKVRYLPIVRKSSSQLKVSIWAALARNNLSHISDKKISKEQTLRSSKQMTQEDWINQPPYRWEGPISGQEGNEEEVFRNRYVLKCFCKKVQFTLSTDPLDIKICHCNTCKKLHGAPMQTAAIFHKTDVRLTKGDIGDIAFFSAHLPNPHITSHATPCPRKVYCAKCGCPLADEGKNMFIVFPSSLHYWKSAEAKGPAEEGAGESEERFEKLPPAFQVKKHIFYRERAFDFPDGIEKWEGLDKASRRMRDDGLIIEGEI